MLDTQIGLMFVTNYFLLNILHLHMQNLYYTQTDCFTKPGLANVLIN